MKPIPKEHYSLKEREESLIQNIEVLARGVDITNNSNESNRKVFVSLKMYKVLVMIMK